MRIGSASQIGHSRGSELEFRQDFPFEPVEPVYDISAEREWNASHAYRCLFDRRGGAILEWLDQELNRSQNALADDRDGPTKCNYLALW